MKMRKVLLIGAACAAMALTACEGLFDSGKDDDPKTLVIQNIPANVYAYGQSDGSQIGIFTDGTTPQQAMSRTGIVAGANLSNRDITRTGSGPYTLIIPLYNGNNDNRWTGSGTFTVYVALTGDGGHYYKADSVSITSETTTVPFSSATEVDPSGDLSELLPELPASTGTNEVGGKTAETSWMKVVFNANGTYTDSREEDGVWTVEATGAYSWNNSGTFKTVTLAPQRAAGPQGNLLDKAAWKAAVRTWVTDQHLDVVEMTGGQYTTLTAFIDAYADYHFALQLYTYTMSGGTITAFEEIGPYGYGNTRGGKVVVNNDTSGTLTFTASAGYEGTKKTTTVSAGASAEVFISGADTFLTNINITTTVSITGSEIDGGGFFEVMDIGRFGGDVFSFEPGPIGVSDGRTVTINVISNTNGGGGPQPQEPLPELPASTGTNEVGGKTLENSWMKVVLDADETFVYYQYDDGVWTVEATGVYSWNSSGSFKTVTAAPQKVAGPEGNLLDKAGWKAAARAFYDGEGYTDAAIAEESEGQYKTLTAFIDAYANYAFALQLYTYTMSGGAITAFEEIGPYGYAPVRGGKVVVKNDTSNTITVKTYAGYAGTMAATTVSAGASTEVFTSSADTFLTNVNITSVSNGMTNVWPKEEDSYGFGGDSGFMLGGPAFSSYDTGPIDVSDGSTVTINVIFYTNGGDGPSGGSGSGGSGGSGGGGSGGSGGGSMPTESLQAALEWLAYNAAEGGEYTITLNANETIGPQRLSYKVNNVRITITGGSTARTVSLSSSYDSLFTVEDGVTLTLGNNVTLQGRSDTYTSLVNVSGGTLVMQTGAKITGNSSSGNAGGVFVWEDGTFTMTGGEISGNSSTSSGGGVNVWEDGTFTMSGGEISGNSSSSYGGGVNVWEDGTFTMSGGEISGNSATYSGGGVFVDGTFTKSGGVIYGSNASGTLKNTAASGDGYGHAVYVNSSPGKKRNTTAGSGVALNSKTSANWE